MKHVLGPKARGAEEGRVAAADVKTGEAAEVVGIEGASLERLT
jgi:hypothetical protein